MSERYDGPEFDEYCISEKAYLPASRDRTPCTTCPLGNLCEAGFREQVRRVVAGENPSLTECKSFTEVSLAEDALLAGLAPDQRAFVLQNVFNKTGG